MFPHTYWIHPDTDGSLRQANEAQAASIYQRARWLARISRAALCRVQGYGTLLLQRAQGERRQADLAECNI